MIPSDRVGPQSSKEKRSLYDEGETVKLLTALES